MTDGRTRGALNKTTGESDTLIGEYERTIRANPGDYDANIKLAGLYYDRGKPGDAEQSIRYSSRALELNLNDPLALYARGLAYAEQGESSKALDDLQVVTVLVSNPDSAKGVYYVMGTIHYKDGNVEEAIDAFEQVKNLDPGFVDTGKILEQLYGYQKTGIIGF
jgi:tetratricopeptide (TPR) repeat protein